MSVAVAGVGVSGLAADGSGTAAASAASRTALPPGNLAAAAPTWHHRDITAAAGAPEGEAVVGFTVAGTDPRLYYQSDDAHLRELAYYQGGWHHRDITAAAGAGWAGRWALAGFAMGGMEPRIYWVDFEEHVHELAYSQGRWSDQDITAAAGAPAPAVLDLAAFQVGATDKRVYWSTYGASHIHELAYYQGSWHHRDVTADTGAPAGANSEITAYDAGNGDSRIYYQDAAHNMRELAYYQGGWHHRNITAATGAPPVDQGPLTAFSVGGADSRVHYLAANGHVQELAYYQGAWHDRDISAAAGDPTFNGARLAGFPLGGDGGSRIYASDSYYGNIWEYAYSGGRWRRTDVSGAAGAPEHPNAIIAFPAAGTGSRVYYLRDSHIHELALYEDAPPPPPGDQTRTVSLQRQPVWEGFIPYLGRFPAFGVVSPGTLLQVRVPQVGPIDTTVYFVKAGRSTMECGDSSAVVPIDEGKATTPAQLSAIFGQSAPRFSTVSPLTFVACIGTGAGEAPDWRNITITVRFD